jgi:hypothetical protein
MAYLMKEGMAHPMVRLRGLGEYLVVMTDCHLVNSTDANLGCVMGFESVVDSEKQMESVMVVMRARSRVQKTPTDFGTVLWMETAMESKMEPLMALRSALEGLG